MSEEPCAFKTLQRKARKIHKCCECLQVINKGDIYQYSSGIRESPASFKQCLKCYKIFELIGDEDESIGFTYVLGWFLNKVYIDYCLDKVLEHYSLKWNLDPKEFKHIIYPANF